MFVYGKTSHELSWSYESIELTHHGTVISTPEIVTDTSGIGQKNAVIGTRKGILYERKKRRERRVRRGS